MIILYEQIEKLIEEENFDKITHMIIEATDSLLTDHMKLLFVLTKVYPHRDRIKGWDRIVKIVDEYLISYGYGDVNALSRLYGHKPEVKQT